MIFANVPAGHDVHDDARTELEYVPNAHVVHDDAPLADDEPPVHAVHCAAPAALQDPAAQSLHAVSPAAIEPYRPAVHWVHTVAPGDEVNEPSGQKRQLGLGVAGDAVNGVQVLMGHVEHVV